MSSQLNQRNPFPAQQAFVVQFATDTPLEVEKMRGRVEHVVSRDATMFDSLEGLIDFVTRILAQIHKDELVRS